MSFIIENDIFQSGEFMINVKFDKRFDLIFGLMYSVNKDHNCGFYWVGSFYPEYDDAFYEIYKKGITPEFEQYIKNGGLNSYNRSISIANSLNEQYEVIVNSDIQSLQKRPNFDAIKLSNYLKEFVEKSGYEKFYESFEPLRSELLQEFNQALNHFVKFEPSLIEDFYGYKIAPMEIILLNFSRGSYGMIFEKSIAYVAGMQMYKYSEKRFMKSIIGNLFHEFSHPYLNPLGQKHFESKDLKNVLRNSKENGLANYYNVPITVINEYVVRAVSAILLSRYVEGELEYEININMSQGFTYIREVIELFSKKDNYETFEDFYKNEIVLFFKELNKSLEVIDHQK